MSVLLMAAALPALSIAQTPPASSDAQAPPATSVAPTPPATSDARTSPAGSDAPKDANPARTVSEIALVLPLSSAIYGRAASAVKAGFLAAAALANAHPAVIAHGDGDVEAAFAQARATGARVIVGPLVRDDLRAVVAAGIDAPTVLALNQLDDTPLPPNMYALTLSVESDARQLARLAREAGVQTVAVVGNDSPLQKRFAAAFVDAWLLQGGAAPVTLRFDRSPEMLALLRRELARTPVDAVVLAVDSADAALVKPYLGTRAAYAGSTVNDRPSPEAMRDLEDLRFVEIPWL
ncbi:MAG TPA: penicillin-binding protein activator, partial [Casimicrobiaceae bacterium]|nr:penicillin-binding protein activator [Casimicrobiaceae bacterium]